MPRKEDSVGSYIHRLEEYFKKSKERLIITTTNKCSGTSTYENPIIRKIQNTKRASKKLPTHLTKKYSRFENENQKWRSTVILPEFISSHRVITLLCSYLFFNKNVNDYVVIDKHISSGENNIYTLYDCFCGTGANYAIYKVSLVP